MVWVTSEYANSAPAPRARYVGWPKRLLDVSIVLLALPFAAPLILALSVLIRRDGGSGLFGHTRVGRGGHEFTCWKLRTMRTDAQACLSRLLANDPDLRRQWYANQKLTDDPRITKIGRFLRQTRLDELPQLWNVLIGEMSIVGPRPVTLDELERYGADRPAYLAMRPGLTGPWQAGLAGKSGYAGRIAADVDYANGASFGMDLAIILRTGLVVLKRSGE